MKYRLLPVVIAAIIITLCGCDSSERRLKAIELRITELEQEQGLLKTNVQETHAIFGEVLRTNDVFIRTAEKLARQQVAENERLERLVMEFLATTSNAPKAEPSYSRKPIASGTGIASDVYKKIMTGVQMSGGVVYGKVIQKIEEGLLVDASTLREAAASSIERGYPPTGILPEPPTGKAGTNYITGTILLTDFPKARTLADGDKFSAIVYPTGQFSYESVGGGRRTIRKYSADLTRATAAALVAR